MNLGQRNKPLNFSPAVVLHVSNKTRPITIVTLHQMANETPTIANAKRRWRDVGSVVATDHSNSSGTARSAMILRQSGYLCSLYLTDIPQMTSRFDRNLRCLSFSGKPESFRCANL